MSENTGVRDIQKIEDDKFLACCEIAILRMRGKRVNSYEQGLTWGSCSETLEARKALGSEATQADWWKACDRGDWLFRQLEKLSEAELVSIQPALERAVERTITRAIHRGQRTLRGVKAPWATEWRRWARRWLNGEDRSQESVWKMAKATGKASWIAKGATVKKAKSAADIAWAAWSTGVSAKAAARSVQTSFSVSEMRGELRRQARDIHKEIPEWPGGE